MSEFICVPTLCVSGYLFTEENLCEVCPNVGFLYGESYFLR